MSTTIFNSLLLLRVIFGVSNVSDTVGTAVAASAVVVVAASTVVDDDDDVVDTVC